ncbi:MAG: hypothetical protein P1Q69_18820 [Candidatus Thorarchaeota archaeon]|nr:hypothetical protein [Candidatus Thorarchaeota archaeon]
MIDKKAILTSILIVSIVGVGVVAVLLGDPSIQQVPPPDTFPDNEIQIVSSGGLLIWAEAGYWQDFMPAVPPEGPPFYLVIKINITNIGDTTVTDLFAPRVTIYYNSTYQSLVTLNLTTVLRFFAPLSISPGESTVVEFTNDRSTIFSPSIEEGTVLYSQVLFSWEGGNEAILTTAPNDLLFTH